MPNIKICELCAVDFTVVKLLMPLILRLKDDGYEVHVVCSEGPYSDAIKKNNIILENIEIPRTIRPLTILKSIGQLYFYFKKNNFDILHVHTPLAAFIGRLAGYLAGVNLIVYTAHGFYFHERMNIVKRLAYQAIEKYFSKITDIIFIQSNEDYEFALKQKFGTKEKIIKIGNGVNLATYQNLKFSELNSSKKITKRRLVVGTCSRLNAEKGIVELVRVSRKLLENGYAVNFLYVLATNASEVETGLEDFLRDFKKDFPENVDIRFNVEMVEDCLAEMDIFTLLSHREGLPRSIIEAIAMSLPILATKIRGSRELINNGVNGILVEVRDEEAIYNALAELITNVNQRLRFSKENNLIRASYDEELVLNRQMNSLRFARGQE